MVTRPTLPIWTILSRLMSPKEMDKCTVVLSQACNKSSPSRNSKIMEMEQHPELLKNRNIKFRSKTNL